MEMNIDINIKTIYPKDDFYLQWSYIYWWQLELNMKLLLHDVICELVKTEVN